MEKENSGTNCEESQSKLDPCKAEKQKEYLERYRFWTSNSIQQLSFTNNLLLVISIAAFGYFFGKRDKIYTNLHFDVSADIDWIIVFFLFGSLLMAFSIFFGACLSISRLYDFRLTRNISITRKRVCQNTGKLLKDEELDKFTIKEGLADLLCIFLKFDKYAVTRNECFIVNETLKNKFKRLRNISLSLGRTTWFLFNLQFLFFLGGIALYAIIIIFM